MRLTSRMWGVTLLHSSQRMVERQQGQGALLTVTRNAAKATSMFVKERGIGHANTIL